MILVKDVIHNIGKIKGLQVILQALSIQNGAEGNRTPVRKPIHYGISHHSLCFDIPSISRPKTGLRL